MLSSSLTLLVLLLCVVVAAAAENTHHTRRRRKHVSFAPHKRIAHDTYYLGEHEHPHDPSRLVQGYAFVHTHRSHSPRHPSTAKATHFRRTHHNHTTAADSMVTLSPPSISRKRQVNNDGFSTVQSPPHCTSPIAEGAVWKTSRGYYINALNSQSITERFLVTAFAQANDAWNCILKANGRMVIGPLLGVRNDLSAHDNNFTRPDGFNVVGLGSIYDKPGTVAVTTVWGVFSGPEPFREIVEMDMIYDEAHFTFGNASVRANVIDFEATTTHEWGHALGLDDVYEDECSDATMFGVSAENQVNKRSLEPCDRTGLATMYPPQI